MAFTYSTYYTLRNTRAADTTVLGLDWEAGEGDEGGAGKPIVCVLYALVIFVSCLWMPATLKALRGEGSVTYVVAILNVVVSQSGVGLGLESVTYVIVILNVVVSV